MEIAESDEQCRKKADSMEESVEPDSKVTVEREDHSPKQAPQSRSAEDGMESDESDEQPENAANSIRDSREPGSKTTLETAPQPSKQAASNVSIFFRIVTSTLDPKNRLIEVQ
jgi:hypothetical protein